MHCKRRGGSAKSTHHLDYPHCRTDGRTLFAHNAIGRPTNADRTNQPDGPSALGCNRRPAVGCLMRLEERGKTERWKSWVSSTHSFSSGCYIWPQGGGHSIEPSCASWWHRRGRYITVLFRQLVARGKICKKFTRIFFQPYLFNKF
jgi:hypothetical protein